MFRICSLLAMFAVVASIGCQAWTSKEKEKNNQFVKETKRFKDLLVDPERPRLVGEVATALGMYAKHYDAYALAVDLPGTGGIVKPGVQRDLMLADMRIRNVDNPETVLDAPWTALVKLKVFANPSDAKGDILDVDVETSTECLATDLTGGYVLESRLREMAYIDGNMRTSDDKAIAQGEIVMLPSSYTRRPSPTPLKGVLIGGAKLIQEQGLGLQITPEYRHVVITKAIEKSINSRFFFREANKQKLVAEGKNDWHIVLESLPKYKHDPAHFVSVILATGFAESDEEQMERVAGCRKLLMKRETTQRGAVELEAIGNDDAKEVLISGLASSDPEIRFFSAYSLSYLDRSEAIPVLMELARYEPAFRPLCLVGLSVNEDSLAREALEELLQEAEPELRFGAFWSIRDRNPNDFVLSGEPVGQAFHLVQIPSAIPLLAVSFQKKKEIVLFGNSVAITLRDQLTPTPSLKISSVPGDQIKLTKRHTDGAVTHAIVASDVVSLLRAMGTVEASYNDVVHTLDTLSSRQALSMPLALNPRPFAGREYNRKDLSTAQSSTDAKMDVVQVDGSSVDRSQSKGFKLSSPVSWFKPSKPSSKKASDTELPPEKNLGGLNEEVSALNP